MPQHQSLIPSRGAGLRLLLSILIVTLNLRSAITCVGPLLETIQAQYNLSSTAAGLLTSLPLFAFGFISPYAAPLARRFGIELAIFISLLLLLAGLGIRYLNGTTWLYLGTALIGTGIAFGNVLLPGLLRRDFPHHIALVTALFTMVLVTMGGLGSGLSVPLAELGGWRFSLVVWSAPVLLALLVWAPQLRNTTQPRTANTGKLSLWNSSLAWQVSLFMGCQSAAFYVLIAWFPSMMSELQDISAARSGWILFIYQLFVLGSVSAVPLLIPRLADQRWIGSGCAMFLMVAYSGLYVDPAHAMVWMMVMGLGAGSSLVLSLTLFGLRTSSAAETVALSGMAQSIGYTLSALMPILLGYIHDQVMAWGMPLMIMIALCLLQVVMGYLSGRPRVIAS